MNRKLLLIFLFHLLSWKCDVTFVFFRLYIKCRALGQSSNGIATVGTIAFAYNPNAQTVKTEYMPAWSCCRLSIHPILSTDRTNEVKFAIVCKIKSDLRKTIYCCCCCCCVVRYILLSV